MPKNTSPTHLGGSDVFPPSKQATRRKKDKAKENKTPLFDKIDEGQVARQKDAALAVSIHRNGHKGHAQKLPGLIPYTTQNIVKTIQQHSANRTALGNYLFFIDSYDDINLVLNLAYERPPVLPSPTQQELHLYFTDRFSHSLFDEYPTSRQPGSPGRTREEATKELWRKIRELGKARKDRKGEIPTWHREVFITVEVSSRSCASDFVKIGASYQNRTLHTKMHYTFILKNTVSESALSGIQRIEQIARVTFQ